VLARGLHQQGDPDAVVDAQSRVAIAPGAAS
jgi:hypothetical protein